MSKEKKKEIKEETVGKKPLIKKIIKIFIILFIAFIIISLLPFIFFAWMILYSVFIDVPSKPKIKHGEFPFELVYEYKGEQHTIKDTITCDYDGYSWSLEGGNSRDWTCEFSKDDEYGQYIIDTINDSDLYIDVPYAAEYYMGNKEYSEEDTRPIIMYMDDLTGTYYQEMDKIDELDIKIVEWKPSGQLEGNIK